MLTIQLGIKNDHITIKIEHQHYIILITLMKKKLYFSSDIDLELE